ncbi:MAG: MFS transporter [Dehalococcoidia bacterium]
MLRGASVRGQTPEPETPTKEPRWFYGWTIVGVVALAAFVGAAEANPVLGLFQGPMTEEFGWSRSLFTLPIAIGSVVGGLLGIVLGPIMDRHGTRWVVTIAALILGLTFVLTGATQELWQYFVLQIIGRSVMMATFFVLVGVVIPKWFVQKRGRAVALANLGQRGGVVAFAVLGERIIQTASWRTAWVAMGLAIWGLVLLPAMLFLRRRPEDHGMLPDGARPDIRTVDQKERQVQRAGQEVQVSAKEALRLPAFFLVTAVVVIQSLAYTTVQFHWFTYFTDQGVSSAVAVTSIAIAPFVSMPVALGVGFFTERFSVRNVMSAGYIILALSIFLLILTSGGLGAIAFGVAFGVTHGVLSTTSQLIWPHFFGRNSVGAIRGMAAPATTTANALGPLVAAVSYDTIGSYIPVYAVIMGLSMLAAVLLLLAQRPQLPAENPSGDR